MSYNDLMLAMIERCRSTISNDLRPDGDRPRPLQSKHLLWMCDRLVQEIDSWSASKMNRWVGFLQCALIANGTAGLEQVKAMFDNDKKAFGGPDMDLQDHLDPGSPFELDLGGEG